MLFFLPASLTALSSLSGSVCICWSAFPHLLRISFQMLCPSEHMTVFSPRSVPPGSLNLGQKHFHSEVGIGKCKSPCSSPNDLPGGGLTWLWMSIEREENKAGFFLPCFFSLKVPDKYFTILLDYLQGLQGGARDTTVQKAEAFMKEFDGSDAEDPNLLEKCERIRQVLQLLSWEYFCVLMTVWWREE